MLILILTMQHIIIIQISTHFPPKLHISAFYFLTFEKVYCTIFTLSVGRSFGWCHHYFSNFALVTWSSSSPSPKKFFSISLLVQNYFCSKISGLIFNLTDLYGTNWSCFFGTRADDCLALTDTDLITHCFFRTFWRKWPKFFLPSGERFWPNFWLKSSRSIADWSLKVASWCPQKWEKNANKKTNISAEIGQNLLYP